MLIHGWTSTAALTFSPTMLQLGKSFRVVAADQRGHGRGIRSRRFSLEDCADDMAALIEHLGLDPTVLVGYSMGGAIAQVMWRRHPKLVAGLVLCSTAARLPGRADLAPAVTAAGLGLSAALSAIPPAWRHRAYVRMVEARDPDQERAQWLIAEQGRNDPGLVIQAAAALNAYDASDWIGEIDVPTSVIVTTRDLTVSPSSQWQMARAIAGAEFTSIAWGHRVCVEAAHQFVPAVEAACRSVLDRAAACPVPPTVP